MMDRYDVIGLMSGTSLDGLDVAFCKFSKENNYWQFKIESAKTYSYSPEWKARLENLHQADALNFVKTHVQLGKLYAEIIRDFISKNGLKPQLISSHGHTIFHQPSNGFTSQIGDGSQIAAVTGIDTVCDFRSKDLALGGQGAPLVPIGDQLLFHEYDFCLNLGGIANVSFVKNSSPYKKNKPRIAFDICPVNMALNLLANEAGLAYDKNGALALTGKINSKLLKQLNEIKYYKTASPKSIGKEWFDKNFSLLIFNKSISLNDRLRTVIEHIAIQITKALEDELSQTAGDKSVKQLLITGGGAHNKFLINCLDNLLSVSFAGKLKIKVPEKKIIDFKEAMIFAFLGILRLRNEVNVLHSVTGTKRDHVGGTIYSGK